MTWLSITLFMTFLSIWAMIDRRKKEQEYEKEKKKQEEFVDNYYKKDLISVKKLVTRYKNER